MAKVEFVSFLSDEDEMMVMHCNSFLHHIGNTLVDPSVFINLPEHCVMPCPAFGMFDTGADRSPKKVVKKSDLRFPHALLSGASPALLSYVHCQAPSVDPTFISEQEKKSPPLRDTHFFAGAIRNHSSGLIELEKLGVCEIHSHVSIT